MIRKCSIFTVILDVNDWSLKVILFTTVKFKTDLTNSNCKLFLGLELTSYMQAADDSKCTDHPA